MAINALLQHEIDRFGVITVMDVMLFDKLNNKPVLFLDTLKMSNITAEGQEKTVTGGKYADQLLAYNYGRSVSIEFQDALLSMASMQEIWGATITDTDIRFHDKMLGKLYGTGVALGANVVKADVQYVFNKTTNLEVALGTNLTVTTGTATFTAGAGATDLLDIYYMNDVPVDVNYTPMEAILKSSSFPKTVKLVGRTFIMEQRTGQMVEIEVEIPKLKLASNFTLTMDAEGDASVFDFSGMALIDGAEKEIFKVRTLGYADVVNA
jgi:hypothetical protein